MMEALAIGLAVYGVAVTFVAGCLLLDCRNVRAELWQEEALAQRWFDRCMEDRREVQSLRAQVRDLNVELAEAGNKLQAFKPFDADGDGFPGGSKPRGKG